MILKRFESLSLILLMFFSFGVLSGFAAPTSGDPDAVLLRYFENHTYVLTKPVEVYHWFKGDGSPVWTGRLSATAPQGVSYVRQMSHLYWSSPWKPDPSSFYGPGLYAALDPVVTRSYGGDQWVLVQMTLPVGFKMLNLHADSQSPVPADVRKALAEFGCSGRLDALLNPSRNPDLRCASKLKDILQGRVGLDGFLYGYFSSELSDCEQPLKSAPFSKTHTNSELRHGAFVIVGDHWLRKGMVRVFNARTRDDLKDRLTIESLFYKVQHDISSDTESAPYPTLISDGTFGSLWPDLQGLKTDPEISKWIRGQLLGCAETLPYVRWSDSESSGSR